jgi:hypothetical protein
VSNREVGRVTSNSGEQTPPVPKRGQPKGWAEYVRHRLTRNDPVASNEDEWEGTPPPLGAGPEGRARAARARFERLVFGRVLTEAERLDDQEARAMETLAHVQRRRREMAA